MAEPEIKDPNILRCAVKKTVSVVSKHILYASYAIVAAASLYIAYLAITGILIPSVILPTVALLSSIAWYWYVAVAIPVAYFGYGVLWCFTREFNDDDRSSDAFGLILICSISAACVGAIIGMIVGGQLIAALGCFAYFAGWPIGEWLSAYLNYRKRVKHP